MSTEAVMIPTAEDLLTTIMSYLKIDYSIDELNSLDPDLVPELVEEINSRTRLHVEAALKAAVNQLPVDDRLNRDIFIMDKITNCYPLTNIK
jgi:hypothetical protein